ncbi:MAG: hypothetical protein R6U26_00015 [Candidatus Undinarchaeales archaeon]
MKLKNKFLPLLIISIVLISAVFYFSWTYSYNKDLTANELLKNPENYDGEIINVSGKVEKVFCLSTEIACPPENPCCNSVSCSLALTGKEGTKYENSSIYLMSDSEPMECKGTDCNLTCDIEPGNYTIIGEFSVSKNKYSLQVEQIL